MTIELQHVTKVFKGERGIFDVSFSLKPGHITALVGSNGAGKSTIINLLTNLLQPDEGTITRAVHDVRYMPDDISFPDTLTAQEIIKFLAGLKNVPAQKQAELLQQVGLDDAKTMKVGQFSKGMRQRLNLAQ
ncbi:MAG TPA: ABC transporter ATP-binding protein, partial [Solibacillus sp.]